MNKIYGLIFLGAISGIVSNVFAQEKPEGKLHLTTGVGINWIQGSLGEVYRSTVAFNSGFEKSLKKDWFAQLDVSFNTLKYDQLIKDDISPFLFQNTNSSIFVLGVNGGKNFPFGASRWFSSLYLGSSYINIGEPRVNVDELNQVVIQDVVRKNGVLGKGGGRLGFKSASSILQTIYIDGSYWLSSIKTQGHALNSVAVFIGMRMVMN